MKPKFNYGDKVWAITWKDNMKHRVSKYFNQVAVDLPRNEQKQVTITGLAQLTGKDGKEEFFYWVKTNKGERFECAEKYLSAEQFDLKEEDIKEAEELMGTLPGKEEEFYLKTCEEINKQIKHIRIYELDNKKGLFCFD